MHDIWQMYDLDALRVAIAFHIRSGAETLRVQNQKAHCIGVQLHSNYFDEKAIQYHPFEMQTLPVASCDTLKLNQAAQALLKRLFRPGIGYKKAGILLMKREKLYPCYTTQWRDLPLAREISPLLSG